MNMEVVTDMNSELQAALELLSMLVLDPRTGVLIGLLLAAAWSDCKTQRIPNLLVFGGAVFGLIYNFMFPPMRDVESLWALQGLGTGLALLLPFYLLRAMGAGDVKLMAMAGAFLGYPTIIYAVLASFLAGGVLAVAYAIWKGVLGRMLVNLFTMFQVAALGAMGGIRPSFAMDSRVSVGKLPYGVAIAAGTIGYLVLRQFGFIQ